MSATARLPLEAIPYPSWLDARLLPSTDADAALAGIVEALGTDIEVEVLLKTPSAPASPTDSRWFRQRGVPAYGFSPFSIDAGPAEKQAQPASGVSTGGSTSSSIQPSRARQSKSRAAIA